jgi:hypothetical protein
MRRCEDCKIILEDDVRFCPKCGGSVAGARVAEPPNVQLGALMTSANLHRVRQEWDAAVTDATAALEIDPNNAEVAALLAAIYEQRGNLDEAAVWYRIALELDPDNAAHRARLERVGRGIGAGPARPAKSRYVLVVAGAAVALVVVTVLLTLAFSRPRPESFRGRAKEPAARPRAIHTASTTAGAPSGQTAAVRPGANLALAGSSSARTPAEAAIKAALAGSESLRTGGATVDDVIADPRQGVVVVTFSLPGTQPITRARVATAAAWIARGAFAANAEVKSVTVRCVVSPGGSASAQIAFVGDIARAAIDGLGENPTEARLDSAFTAKWWNPQIR